MIRCWELSSVSCEAFEFYNLLKRLFYKFPANRHTAIDTAPFIFAESVFVKL